jgi:DNA ligase-1
LGTLINSFSWISEKLDGVRAYWNGKTLTSKRGKEILCPGYYLEQLPKDMPLDGELWMGRGTFELLNEFLNFKADTNIWKNIIFMVFDLPTANTPYEIRMRDLANLKLPQFVHVVEVQQCRGNSHLHDLFTTTLAQGGEGLMVVKPNSIYVPYRTGTLLKVKVRYCC